MHDRTAVLTTVKALEKFLAWQPWRIRAPLKATGPCYAHKSQLLYESTEVYLACALHFSKNIGAAMRCGCRGGLGWRGEALRHEAGCPADHQRVGGPGSPPKPLFSVGRLGRGLQKASP